MSFLRSRHQQLADHLRNQIRSGRLAEPLPTTREWAAGLGVSGVTLRAALHILRREKRLVIVPRRGVRLLSPEAALPAGSGQRLVRLLERAADSPQNLARADWYGIVSQQLQAHGILLTIEPCSDRRLIALSRAPAAGASRDLFLLRSLPERFQRRFDRGRRPAIVVGSRAPGVALPFVTTDVEGAIRHAAHHFLRRGFIQLTLLVNRTVAHAAGRQRDAFVQACADWPHQPVRGEILAVPLEGSAQLRAVHQFTGGIKDRRGLIVVLPVSLAGVMTSLHARRIDVPGQVEVVAVSTTPVFTVLWPPPRHYQVSGEALARALVRAAVHFFETDALPRIEKTVPLRLVIPPAW